MRFMTHRDFWPMVISTGISMLLIAKSVPAQTTQPDVNLNREAGVYPIGCHTPADTDLDQACWVRVDQTTGPVELGCIDSPLPNKDYGTSVTIQQTPDENADIRCYVVDIGGLVSDLSDNKGIVDFTRPGKPSIAVTPVSARIEFDSSELVAARHRMPNQQKHLLITVEE